jgi:hypothetical protein
MRITNVLPMKRVRVVIGCLRAGVLTAVACTDG